MSRLMMRYQSSFTLLFFFFFVAILKLIDCSHSNGIRVIRREPVVFKLELPETFAASYSMEKVRFLSQLYSFSKDVSSQNSSYEYHFTFLIRAALRDHELVKKIWEEMIGTTNSALVNVEDFAERVYRELFAKDPQEARRALEIMDYVLDDAADRNLTYRQVILKYMRDNSMGTKDILKPDEFFRLLNRLRDNSELSDQLSSIHRTVLCNILATPGGSEANWAFFWVTFGNYFNRAVYKNRNSTFFWTSLAFSALTDFSRHFPGEAVRFFGRNFAQESAATVHDEFNETPGEPPVDNFKQASTCGHIPTLVHLLRAREGQILHQKRADLCLFQAIDKGNVETVEFLLRSGLKFSQSQIDEVFRIAQTMGYTKLLNFRLEKASVSAPIRSPAEALIQAIRSGNLEVIDSVINVSVGGALTFSEPVLNSAMHEAISSKNERVLEHLY